MLVPDGLDARKSIEVVVFLHGHTEGTHRPFGGFRTLDQTVKGAGKHMQDLRRGIDPTDTAPVRDVALDQSAQQLEDSKEKQLVIVLPQGGLYSQFSKTGGKDFDATPYVNEIVTRLQTEKKWKDDKGGVAAAAPSVTRIVMAGHSGAGAALSHMANADKPGVKPGESSALPNDLVIYDAINGWGQRNAFEEWATRRLDEDLAILTDPTIDDKAKLVHLNTAPKLLGYTTDSYIDAVHPARQGDRGVVRQEQGRARPVGRVPARELPPRVPRRPPRGADARLRRRRPARRRDGHDPRRDQGAPHPAHVARRLPRVAAVAPGALLGDPP